MRKALAFLAVVMIVAGVAISRGPAEEPNKVADFMRLKLDHAQDVLEGLALEDYALIDKNAQKLTLLSQASNWQVLQTPEYLQESVDFRRSTDALSKAAKEKNLDGALVAYMDMTMKCVRCHEYVRDTRMAKIEVGDLPKLGMMNPATRPSEN